MIFCLSGCNGFNWKPHGFSFTETGIIDSKEVEVLFTDPAISEFTCFPYDNLEELRNEIDRIKNKENDYIENYDY